MKPTKTLTDYSYLLLGIIQLAVAFLITVGVGFSSAQLSAKMMVFIVIPLFLGIFAFFFARVRLLAGAMLLGCISTLAYIGWFTRGSLKSGNSILPFHVIWSCMSLALAMLALIKIVRPQRTEV
jgi:hypothetical protein